MRLARSIVELSVLCVCACACACASGGARGVDNDSPLRMPVPKLIGAPALASIVPVAGYAWVPPSRVFAPVDSREDSVALSASLEGFRESGALVLRANGWREVEVDEAAYHLTVIAVERARLVETFTPDPRDGRTVEGKPCPTPPPGQRDAPKCERPRDVTVRYPQRRSVALDHQRRVGFAIVRRTDGAIRWWLIPDDVRADSERFMARAMLELLLTETAGRP